ncbi:MAG TPA: hypothetical protein VLK82_09315 [Candidatus Tectomicrobia bacterium]|nr:hypothetical protein [Candidatus Tectomicrobia bacterium]
MAEVEAARHFAEGVVQTAPWPLLILDRHLRVLKANPAFYQVFRTSHTETEDRWILRVQDNGIGLPPEIDITHPQSLGLNLVHDLASQVGAVLSWIVPRGRRLPSDSYPSSVARGRTA